MGGDRRDVLESPLGVANRLPLRASKEIQISDLLLQGIEQNQQTVRLAAREVPQSPETWVRLHIFSNHKPVQLGH